MVMFIVEGNIGTGKTTFLKLLQQTLPGVLVALEAVDYWQKSQQDQSILENFYKDPKRWAYTMETLSLQTRVREHIKQQNSATPYIVERSIYSGNYCFARNSFEQGFLQDIEWSMYQAWFDFLTGQECLPPLGFIYLQADPKVSYQRVLERNRKAESSISYEYLEQIHNKHENFLIDKKNVSRSICNVPVLVLDCNYNVMADKKLTAVYLQKVQDFIFDQLLCNLKKV
ncbi:MAG: deoxynucleoside kinase [Candidatus Chromulinivorax sp.]